MSYPVIISAKRTAIGSFQGVFSTVKSPQLGAQAIKVALEDSSLSDMQIDEVIMGCVLPAGLGQAPARQAALGADMALSTPTSTVNKVCGSGLRAIISACDQIKAKSAKAIIAGGMESMSNAPYLSPNSRSGARLGHVKLIDHMFLDGLEDAYTPGKLMGHFAEATATRYQFSRQAQDAFALDSLAKAQSAQARGAFDAEIAAMQITTRNGVNDVGQDEQPSRAKPDKIPHLRPAFDANGTVTAANSSSISDGAAALVLADCDFAAEQGATTRAQVVGYCAYAHEPEWFTTAPVPATQKLLKQIGWQVDMVDLWEVNEAFAVVPMVFMHELGIPAERLNVNGGACALGHPIGASGARIVVTLLHAMEAQDAKRGVGAICIGGGEGLAIALQRD